MDTKTETRISLTDSSLLHEQCYIDGAWVDAADGKSIDVNNPATGEIIASVPSLSGEETRRAIEAANAAWPQWRARTGKERAGIMRRWYDLMMEHQEDLAVLMTSEQGKPLVESRGEIAYAASFIEWFAEEGKRVYGDTMDHPLPGRRIVVIKQPIGVVAAITPWNFPAAMITRKCAPAMAAGCPVVIKPASQTPLSALALAELAHRAGIPKGVLNVITGKASVLGGELTGNPTVRKLSFTGSTEIGKLLMSQCAGTVKKVSLELGGNAPFIVFDDADLDAAVVGAMASKYRNAGQTCVCANRFLVQDGIYDAFAERMAAAVKDLKVGNGLEEGVNQGLSKDPTVKSQIDEATRKIILGALLQREIESRIKAPSQEEVNQYHLTHSDEFQQEKQVKARHILLKDETEAKKIAAELKKGAEFTALARDNSSCPSAAQGGDLGFFTRNRMVKEFADAAFALKKGEVSPPIKTKFGYHLIKVTEKQ